MVSRRRSVRRKTGGRRSGRRILQAGALFRGAARLGAQAVRNYRRVQPAAKYVAAGVGGTAAVGGIGAYRSGYRAAALNKKRASRVKRTRPRGSNEVKIARATYGRRMVSASKIMRAAIPRRIFRFQGIKLMENADATTGYYQMRNMVSTTTAGSLMPMYVMALNSTTQGNIFPSCFYSSTLLPNGRMTFANVNGFTAIGGLSASLQVESSNAGADPFQTNDKVANQWHQFKLKLYAARTQHTEYLIDLVQCNADYAGIEDESDLALMTGTHGVRYQDSVYAWWQNMVKPLLTSTIMDSQNKALGAQRPFRILRSWRYTITPNMSDASDTSPNSVDVKLFIKDGRVLNYSWADNPQAYNPTIPVGELNGLDDTVANPNMWWQYRTGTAPYAPAYNPHPRHRRYLVIRSRNPVSTLGTDQTSDNTPSFDMIYRKGQTPMFGINV